MDHSSHNKETHAAYHPDYYQIGFASDFYAANIFNCTRQVRYSLTNPLEEIDEETDPLDAIIRNFNERWFQGWSATPEEQRVEFVNIVESVKNHRDFKRKYQEISDPHNRELAFEKMLKEVMLLRRKDELELYKLFANDSAFKTAWQQSIQHEVERNLQEM